MAPFFRSDPNKVPRSTQVLDHGGPKESLGLPSDGGLRRVRPTERDPWDFLWHPADKSLGVLLVDGVPQLGRQPIAVHSGCFDEMNACELRKPLNFVGPVANAQD